MLHLFLCLTRFVCVMCTYNAWRTFVIGSRARRLAVREPLVVVDRVVPAHRDSRGLRHPLDRCEAKVRPYLHPSSPTQVLTSAHPCVAVLLLLDRVLFTLQLHSLFDLLSVVSHFAINFQTYVDGDQYRRSWLDFGFLRSYIAYVVVDHLFTRYKNKTFFAQVLLVIFKAWCLVFFAACVLFSLERLGDIPYTDSFLLHVYKCSNADGSKSILLKNSAGTDEYPDCSESWSFFSSIYFIFVTVSTVGYGDFSPKTVLGQLMVCVIIVFGIYTFANESAAFMTLYGDQRGERAKYNCSRNTAHVIVTGNPSAAQMKDFIREFFHPDHEVLFRGAGGESNGFVDGGDEDEYEEREIGSSFYDKKKAHEEYEMNLEEGNTGAGKAEEKQAGTSGQSENGVLASKWLQRRGANKVRETHIVVLMRFDKDDENSSFQKEVMEFVHDNPRYHKRVFLIYGSPLRKKDLDHAKLRQAMAVFFLPNKFSNDGNKEDASTVLRVLSVTQQIEHHTQLFAMLVNSDNRTLLEATGMSSEHLVCADELRLGLMGLSCRCPGLSTLVSNLITSRSGGIPSGAEDAGLSNLWISEYVAGAANEIYSCGLAPHFVGLTFTEAAQRIHNQSDGLVLLIAVEADGKISFNPGRWFHITATCKAYLIAESMSSLEPFSGPSSFSSPHGAMMTNLSIVKGRNNLVNRARRAQHNVERRIPAHVREYILRCGSSGIGSFQSPKSPSPALLAQGGHIVVCSNAASEGGGQRSVSRLVNFLRPLRAPHIERIVPVVLVDSEKFDDISWLQLSQFGEVYQVQGSPQRHNVLVAAGIYSASAIVVLAQGTETGYDDSKAIFNAILVNSALQSSHIFTIIELRDVHNNKFLDPVASFSSRSYDDDIASEFDATFSPVGRNSQLARSNHGGRRFSVVNSVGGGSNAAHESRYGGRSSSVARRLTWLEKQVIVCRLVLFNVQAFFMGNIMSAAHRVNEFNHSDASAAPTLQSLYSNDDEDDTFFQERFMGGALFPSYVADDLLIQSFFNPSLNVFIRKILDGKSCFMLYDIPKQWRHQPLTYGTLFSHMTSGIAHALPIGLLRAKGGANGAPYPYVYTCPASSTIVYSEDKVFVIIDVKALHRVANKLQRRFRNRRKVNKDPVTFGDTVNEAVRRSSATVAANKTL